jgi:hypothetical protein
MLGPQAVSDMSTRRLRARQVQSVSGRPRGRGETAMPVDKCAGSRHPAEARRSPGRSLPHINAVPQGTPHSTAKSSDSKSPGFGELTPPRMFRRFTIRAYLAQIALPLSPILGPL